MWVRSGWLGGQARPVHNIYWQIHEPGWDAGLGQVRPQQQPVHNGTEKRGWLGKARLQYQPAGAAPGDRLD